MSLLADLLSKKNSAAPQGGKDIPPTLSEAHDIPAKVRTLKSRYIAIAVLCTFCIIAGVMAMIWLEEISVLFTDKPTTVIKQAKPNTPAPIAAVPAEVKAPPEPPKIIESTKPTVEQPAKKTFKKVTKKKPAPYRKAPTHRLAAVIPIKSTVSPSASNATTAAHGAVDTAKRDAYLYAARSAEQVSDWRTALSNYRKAQKIDPENYVIMNNMAAALNNLAMFDEGAREARRSQNKKPGFVPAMVNEAIAYSSKGNNQEALRLFSEAALADPGNRSLTINLGILQERTGKLDQAQATYRPLAQDGDPLALQGMARIYERKGNRMEAIRTYRQIMTLQDASPGLKKEVKNNLVRLEE